MAPEEKARQGAADRRRHRALAEQLAGFPQQTMLADRASAYAQWDFDVPSALNQEWQPGKACIGQGLEGATHLASGSGQYGKF